MVDYEGFPALQEQARAEGRRIGLGIGQELIPEGCSMPGSLLLNGCDGTEVRVSPTGEVTVLTGRDVARQRQRDRHRADRRRRASAARSTAIRVVQGDTETCPWGFGNYSARSIIIGGSAAHLAATDVKEKMLKVAGNMLEASPADLEAAEAAASSSAAPPTAAVDARRGGARGLSQPAREEHGGDRARARGAAALQDRQRLPPAGDAGPLQRLSLLAERRRRVHRRGRRGDGLREGPPLLHGPRRGHGS